MLREERGWTVHELTIVSLLLAVVLAATLTLLDKTMEIFPADRERAHAVRDAQVGLHEITRELRQAYAVESPASGPAATGRVQVRVTVRSVDHLVAYDCTVAYAGPGDKCVRESQVLVGGAPSGPVSRRDVLFRVLNGGSVFTRPSASFMQARVEVPAKAERPAPGDHAVVLDDGFHMRNVPSSG